MNSVKLIKEDDLSLNISYYHILYDFGSDMPPVYYEEITPWLYSIWIEIYRLKWKI